ncbi:MAG: L-arabinose isomerase [Candidatus Izemoplasmataceae bacterium]
MKMMKKYRFWLVVGTQHLYGESIFNTIETRALEVAKTLNDAVQPFASVEFKQLVKTTDEATDLFKEVNEDDEVTGVITWMHTFSPSKMWIRGLSIANKPILHLHTQFNKEIPWDEIDMDFMNLNQAAHGDREHGFIYTRMQKQRKVISGHYTNKQVLERIKKWTKSAAGVYESKKLNVARFGDNMRYVAVTEGNKVDAEIKFGWSINTYGIGDLARAVEAVNQNELREQMLKYEARYQINTDHLDAIKYQAQIEVALRKFLDERNAKAFTTTFEDLHGLKQLPGLAVQDLMLEGYGFGAEGDWKTAAMLRLMKLMSSDSGLGNSFMEDYTYHLEEGNELVLGAHMLEVCPSIADKKPVIEVHELGIGGKNAPARAIFDAKSGKAIQVTLVDLGHRYRMIVSDCEAIKPLKDMPKLPVARAMWSLKPSFSVATEAWLISGGAHHTVMSYDLDAEILRDFAEMLNIEFIHINEQTNITALKQELLWNQSAYQMIK